METLQADTLRGTWGTLLLPVNEEDAIDWMRLQHELEVLVASGLHGLYTNGTAAEFYTLSTGEYERISAMAAAACQQAGLPFQLGVSHPCPQESLDRLHRSKQWQPGTFQVILPDWSPVTIDEAIFFLARMAEEAAPIPLVVYNPPHAKKVLTPEEWGRVHRAVPAVIGIKVLGGDAAWYAQMQQHAPRLSIFVAGHTLASAVPLGAQGSYSNMACMNPVAAVAWWDLIQEDAAAALELEGRIGTFFQKWIRPLLVEDGYSNQAADKLLATLGGWADVGTQLRWPYRGFAASEVARLRPVVRELIPEFYPGTE